MTTATSTQAGTDIRPFRVAHPRRRAGRPAPPAGAHPLRRPRARRQLGLRHPGRLPARHGHPLARVRLAGPGAADQRRAPVRDRDRRAAGALRARPLGRAGRHPAAARAHLPRDLRRVPRHDRPAHRPGGARRPGRGRVSPGHPVDPGLRVLHPADRRRPGRTGLDDGPGGPHLRHPDAPARLRLLRRARQRRRRADLPRAGHPGPRRLPRRARAAAVLVPVR